MGVINSTCHGEDPPSVGIRGLLQYSFQYNFEIVEVKEQKRKLAAYPCTVSIHVLNWYNVFYAIFLKIKICKSQLNNLRRYDVNVLISWYFLEQFIKTV